MRLKIMDIIVDNLHTPLLKNILIKTIYLKNTIHF